MALALNARAATALATAALVARNIDYGYSLYNSASRYFSTAQSAYNMAKRAGSYLGRPAAKRFRRARRSTFRSSKKRRGGRGRVGTPRGKRYTRYGSKIGKRLNTNFAVNDRRMIRVVERLGQIAITPGVLTTGNTQRFHIGLHHARPEWNSIILNYSEFKISGVQFVLEPRSVRSSSENIRVAPDEIPYLVIRTGLDRKPLVPVTDIAKLRQTPGYRYVRLTKRSRTVINCSAMVAKAQTFADASVQTFESVIKMPWMKLTTAASNYDVCMMEIVRPEIAALDADEIYFDVSVYFTVHLRGNITAVVEPVD